MKFHNREIKRSTLTAAPLITGRFFVAAFMVSCAMQNVRPPGLDISESNDKAVHFEVHRNQPEGAAESVGMAQTGLDKLTTVFKDMLDQKMHPGAQLSVYRNGQLVIELWGGRGGTEAENEVTMDTLFQIRSHTKMLCAISDFMHVSEGAFEFDDKVSAYWPDFHGMAKKPSPSVIF